MKCLANPSVASRMIQKQVSLRFDVISRIQLACAALILADKHEFERDQLIKFLDETKYLYNSVKDGHVDFDDITSTLLKEYGINTGVNLNGKKVFEWELG